MKGYLTTCDGAQFELPTLLKWEFSYTGSVPCDSFTLRCAYEPAMAETLRRAVRFTAREDGTVEFAGVVDECGVTCDEKGLQLEVSGRGMAALLLDNEAESVSYQWATMEEILKNHVTPYGIVCTGYDAVTAAARYRVANGSSQWKALNDFAALHGGIAPYFDKTGALEVKKNRKAARCQRSSYCSCAHLLSPPWQAQPALTWPFSSPLSSQASSSSLWQWPP